MVVCVCFTLVSLLVFLMCPVAPYCSCLRVISSSSWGVLGFRRVMCYSSVHVGSEHCVW